ncbi:LysR family transcriptional regulator ArgP [Frondihabitans cladoniiphilus]|uniref:LysR family transcriptional regulator ArgP n=1 Tax=Frondihabitans cladoniiphilus TaxID=715785 RepID=A0ABP8VX91_9MICO
MQNFGADQLGTLLALVEEGTFERAAARLHVTGSAVSQRVKAMEHAAGRVLVVRTTPVGLTEAGDVLLRHARQVALLEADTARALGGADGAGAVPMALAVNADSLATWFLPALAPVAADHDVVFELHREDQENTTSLLRSGTVLAAVTSTREAVQGCLTTPLGAMRYRAVCSPAFAARWRGVHPTGSGVSWLQAAPVVAFDRTDDLQDAFLRRHVAGSAGGPRHHIPTSDDFARAIALGFGWGMLPELQCTDAIASGALVDVAPRSPVDVELHWQRWNLASPLLDAVTAAVRAAARTGLRRPR